MGQQVCIRAHRWNRTFSLITAMLLFAGLFVAQFFTAASCFATDFSTKATREETLFIKVPQGWQVEEFGSLDEDAEMIEAGKQSYKVLELQDAGGVKQGELWIYAEPINDAHYYCDAEEDAEEYYDDSGSCALDYVIEEAFPDAGSWTSEVEYIKGENEFTYVIHDDAYIEKDKYDIYISCDFTQQGGVHEVLLFEGAGNREIRDRIAESVEGYGYASEIIDNREYSGYDDTFHGNIDLDNSGIIELLASALIWVVLAGFIIAKIRSITKNSDKTGRRILRQKQPARIEKTGMRSAAQMQTVRDGKAGKTVRKGIDKWVLRETRLIRADHEEHDDCQILGSKYTGYRESLKTLHKSGLLTTKEMNELLEKHKYDV